MSEKKILPSGPYSNLVRAGDWVILSGQLPQDPETGDFPESIDQQMRQAMSNVKDLLEAEGLSLEQLVRVRILTTDLSQFNLINEVYQEFFTKNHLPARTCYQVEQLPRGAKVEVEATACSTLNRR